MKGNFFRITILFCLFINITSTLPAGRLLRKSSDDLADQSKPSAPETSKLPNIVFAHKRSLRTIKLINDFELTTTNPMPCERKSITLTTRDGLTRYGVLTTRSNAKGNVVLCHPAAYDQTFLIPYEEKVFSYYNCIRFDFRRHGKNNKRQTTTIGKKEIFEIEAAVNYLKSNLSTKKLPIYGFGISLGASALIEAEGQKHQFDALILQSPFESLREQIKRTFPLFRLPLMHNLIFREPVRLYAKLKYRIRLCKVYPERSIKKIKTPVFLMHAQNDSVVDFSAHKKLKLAGQHCIVQTWTPQTGKHTEMFKTFPDLYTKKCNAFLNKVAYTHRHLNYKLAHHKFIEKEEKILVKADQVPALKNASYNPFASTSEAV